MARTSADIDKIVAEKIAEAEYEKRMNSYPQRPGNEVCEVQLNHIPEQLRLLDNDNDGLSMCVDMLVERLSGAMSDYPMGGVGKDSSVPEASMSTVACQIKHQRGRVQQACARLRDILDRLEL